MFFLKILNYNVTLITFPGFPGRCSDPVLYENQVDSVLWITLQKQFVLHQSEFQIWRVPVFNHHIYTVNSVKRQRQTQAVCFVCLTFCTLVWEVAIWDVDTIVLVFLAGTASSPVAKIHMGVYVDLDMTLTATKSRLLMFSDLILSVSLQQFGFLCLKILSGS